MTIAVSGHTQNAPNCPNPQPVLFPVCHTAKVQKHACLLSSRFAQGTQKVLVEDSLKRSVAGPNTTKFHLGPNQCFRHTASSSGLV